MEIASSLYVLNYRHSGRKKVSRRLNSIASYGRRFHVSRIKKRVTFWLAVTNMSRSYFALLLVQNWIKSTGKF